MRPGKKFALEFLPTFACLIAILVACNSPINTKQLYRWAAAPLKDIKTFDPGIATDEASINAIAMVFTGMVQLDDQLMVQPQMAQTYDHSTDGLTYIFHLRPNLKFSDGSKLDANDVAYSIDRALSPEINNQTGTSLSYLGLIKNAAERTTGKVKSVIGTGVIVQGQQTVIIKLIKPARYFLQALTYPTSYVVEKSVIDKWGAQWTEHLSDNGGQGGAGPFKVARYSHSTGIDFVPNPNYYGPKPQLQKVSYLFYKTDQASYQAYQTNQVDETVIPAAEYPRASQSKEFNSIPELTIAYIAMNYLVKPLDNVKIRQALALALDKDAIVQAVWKGAYIPTCHIVPRGMVYGYNPNLVCPAGSTTKGDPARAKVLFQQGLQEEGLTTATFPTLTLSYPSESAEIINEVTAEEQMWKYALGINIVPTAMNQSTMYTLESQTTGHSGPLQMWLASWGADYPDPQDWLTLQFGDGQPFNQFNYGNNHGATAARQRQVQQQMDVADFMADQNARLQAYNKAEQQLVNDVAWLPVYQRSGFQLRKSYVKGFTTPSAFTPMPPNDWAKVYLAAH